MKLYEKIVMTAVVILLFVVSFYALQARAENKELQMENHAVTISRDALQMAFNQSLKSLSRLDSLSGANK